jgi:hypothetical protein
MHEAFDMTESCVVIDHSSIAPKFTVVFHDNLPGVVPVPWHPGWSVSKLNPRNGWYEHCGFIFKTVRDAETWKDTGIFPDDYWKIDWNLFPNESGYIHIESPVRPEPISMELLL